MEIVLDIIDNNSVASIVTTLSTETHKKKKVYYDAMGNDSFKDLPDNEHRSQLQHKGCQTTCLYPHHPIVHQAQRTNDPFAT